MKKAAVIAAWFCLSMSGNVSAQETENWSLEQKVAQMFFVTPDQLSKTEGTNMVGAITREAFSECPVGGIIFMENNLVSEEQIRDMTKDFQDLSMEMAGVPIFLGVDEEGGRVARIANADFMDVKKYPPMYEIGISGDEQMAYQVGKEIGSYLSDLGFTVDFAPVADVWTEEENTVIGNRAFSSDSELAAKMVAAQVQGFHDSKIKTAVKHFPGHGNTKEDSHSGFAYSYQSKEEMQACEWKPFLAGIEQQSEFVMVGHICCPNITKEEVPASLSRELITEVLRGEMGFEGLVITDAMDMGAITEYYSCAEAAVLAVEAGADIILMPENLEEAYEGVLQAVKEGRIGEERIEESVSRIWKEKDRMTG